MELNETLISSNTCLSVRKSVNSIIRSYIAEKNGSGGLPLSTNLDEKSKPTSVFPTYSSLRDAHGPILTSRLLDGKGIRFEHVLLLVPGGMSLNLGQSEACFDNFPMSDKNTLLSLFAHPFDDSDDTFALDESTASDSEDESELSSPLPSASATQQGVNYRRLSSCVVSKRGVPDQPISKRGVSINLIVTVSDVFFLTLNPHKKENLRYQNKINKKKDGTVEECEIGQPDSAISSSMLCIPRTCIKNITLFELPSSYFELATLSQSQPSVVKGVIIWTRSGEKYYISFQTADMRFSEGLDLFLTALDYSHLTESATIYKKRREQRSKNECFTSDKKNEKLQEYNDCSGETTGDDQVAQPFDEDSFILSKSPSTLIEEEVLESIPQEPISTQNPPDSVVSVVLLGQTENQIVNYEPRALGHAKQIFLASCQRPGSVLSATILSSKIFPPFLLNHVDAHSKMSLKYRSLFFRHVCRELSVVAESLGKNTSFSSTWFAYDIYYEAWRQQISDRWGISKANKDFLKCSTYPELLIEPCDLCEDSDRCTPYSNLKAQCGRLEDSNQSRERNPTTPSKSGVTFFNDAFCFRSRCRVQTLTYFHAFSGGAILRSSQPVLWHLSKPKEMTYHILKTCKSRPLIVFDLRPKLNAAANAVHGGTYEQSYEGIVEVRFCDIPNIHSVTSSFENLMAVCQSGAPRLQRHADAKALHTSAGISQIESTRIKPKSDETCCLRFSDPCNRDLALPSSPNAADSRGFDALSSHLPSSAMFRNTVANRKKMAFANQLPSTASLDQLDTPAKGQPNIIKSVFGALAGVLVNGTNKNSSLNANSESSAAKNPGQDCVDDWETIPSSTVPSVVSGAIAGTAMLGRAIAGGMGIGASSGGGCNSLSAGADETLTPLDGTSRKRPTLPSQATMSIADTKWLDYIYMIISSSIEVALEVAGSTAYLHSPFLSHPILSEIVLQHETRWAKTKREAQSFANPSYFDSQSICGTDETLDDLNVPNRNKDTKSPQSPSPPSLSQICRMKTLFNSDFASFTDHSVKTFCNLSDSTRLLPTHAKIRMTTSPVTNGSSVSVISKEHYGKNVVVHCSDGWDRTSQVSALSQIMLDPYFRTIKGFCVIIEKDFVSFGHQFRLRSDYFNRSNSGRDANEQTSPIFIQFIDCVYQLLKLYPRSFEFTETFLLFVIDLFHSGISGTFAANSIFEINMWKLKEKTLSLWQIVSIIMTSNPFIATEDDLSLPKDGCPDAYSKDAADLSGFVNPLFVDVSLLPVMERCKRCIKRERRKLEKGKDLGLPHDNDTSSTSKFHQDITPLEHECNTSARNIVREKGMLYCPTHQEEYFIQALLTRPPYSLTSPISPLMISLWSGFFLRKTDFCFGRGLRTQVFGVSAANPVCGYEIKVPTQITKLPDVSDKSSIVSQTPLSFREQVPRLQLQFIAATDEQEFLTEETEGMPPIPSVIGNNSDDSESVSVNPIMNDFDKEWDN